MATTGPVTEVSMKLRLSKHASDGLAQRAAAAGKEIAEVASDLIEHAIAASPPSDMPYEQWAAEFNAWTSNHKPTGHFVDDSRESIYARRDE